MNKLRWEEGNWSWIWNWRRILRGRAAGQFKDLLLTLQEFTPNEYSMDSWKWSATLNGVFTVSCLSKMITSLIAASLQQPTMWSRMLPKKLNSFTWRAVNELLPVRAQLQRRGIILQTDCPLCLAHTETVNHPLPEFHFADDIWTAVSTWCNTDNSSYSSSHDILRGAAVTTVHPNEVKVWKRIICITGWAIWKARNALVMQSTPSVAAKIIAEIQVNSFLWIPNRSAKHLTWSGWLVAPLHEATAQGID